MDTIDMLPEVPSSFWIDSTPGTDYPALDRDIGVDIAIIGGGIAGITTAYLLKQAGDRWRYWMPIVFFRVLPPIPRPSLLPSTLLSTPKLKSR